MIASGQKHEKRGFLAGLLADQRGNTVAIVAAAVIPLAAMVGSGVDMSRNYLVKSRLQQACDAGALGGRRAMGANSWGTATNTVARNFFKTNFIEGSYGTTGLTYSYTENQGTVSGTASVEVPTSIMRIFGYTSIPVSVTCSGKMKIPNSDVMFVLDTTGSMGQTNAGDTSSKMEGLKAAVRNFYNTLESSKGTDTRIRYGFVPFSANVNVGFLLQRDWMVDDWTYQSRQARFTGNYNSSPPVTTPWSQIGGSYTDSTSTKTSSCPTDNFYYNDTPTTTSSTDEDGNITTVTVTKRVWNGNDYSCTSSTITKRAYSNYTEQSQTTTVKTPKYDWQYKPVAYDVAGLKGDNADGSMEGGSITAAIGNLVNDQPTSRTVNWAGCIEERDTVRATNFSPIPSGAIDLDIDKVPDSDASRWRPSLGGLVFARAITVNQYGQTSGGWNTNTQTTTTNYGNIEDTGNSQCPSPARRLNTMSLSELNSYLSTLQPVGSTYHDIGMLWGARLISPTGLFAADNSALPPNGGSIARHIIYMTDGITDSGQFAYTSYGLEPLDQRRAAWNNEATIDTNIQARFAALCTATKNKNITVWVVSFGTAMTPMLSNCASPGKSYQAANSAALNAAFATIATEIAQLRLTQ